MQEKLKATDWDLVVCDEAHKMSATFWGGEVRRTKRHMLGQLLSTLTRNFLLLTATPHNGKEEDFQLFLSLLDGDRFGPVPRGGSLQRASDLMRRMVRRIACSMVGHSSRAPRLHLQYELSDGGPISQARHGLRVEEFNRAEKLPATAARARSAP